MALFSTLKHEVFRATIFFGTGIILCSITYAAISWPSAPAGETSGGKYSARLVPSGFVGAFNLATCPSGWLPADGSAGTPDLRGRFVRGINGASIDPDGNRALASLQDDMFKAHQHGIGSKVVMTNGASWWPSDVGGSLNNGWGVTDIQGWAETRPKNAALLYCQKN